jgi:sigma-B regulation protein RsbU (phosphoserine phosphatase)
MVDSLASQARDQLLDRRTKLESALVQWTDDSQLQRLLSEVDAALSRMDEGTYGLCETCNDNIEPERLIADPLVQYCLDHLTTDQQRALEQDLQLASQIQSALLPEHSVGKANWEVAYHYEPAGPVSGDYCDLLDFGGDLYFTVGDVTGKGVAASMLMAHLRATFRGLISLELPLDKVVERASRTFCESTLPTHFATLVCGKAHASGKIEICNAGHNPPLLAQGENIKEIASTGLPLGIFCEERFSVSELQLLPSDIILIYTDGLTEARDSSGLEYGTERLSGFLKEHRSLPPEKLVSSCIEDLISFRSGAQAMDDTTVMAIRRKDGRNQ